MRSELFEGEFRVSAADAECIGVATPIRLIVPKLSRTVGSGIGSPATEFFYATEVLAEHIGLFRLTPRALVVNSF